MPELFENPKLEHCIRCGGRGRCEKENDRDEIVVSRCPYCEGTGMTDENPPGRGAGAEFSLCGKYRYKLWRCWDWERPTIAFIGLNPSTADGSKLDNTTTKCVKWAKRDGFGQYIMLNLFGLVSTNPAGLKTATDPNGPDNNAWITKTLAEVKAVVFCWGATSHKLTKPRIELIEMLARDAYQRPLCPGLTKGGFPKHPCYLANDTRLIEYPRRE